MMISNWEKVYIVPALVVYRVFGKWLPAAAENNTIRAVRVKLSGKVEDQTTKQ